VKFKDHRFAFAMGLMGLALFGSIAGYFAFFAPHHPKMDLSTIQKILNRDIFTTENELDIPGITKLTPGKASTTKAFSMPQIEMTSPVEKVPTAAFTDKQLKPFETEAGVPNRLFTLNTVFPPSKLASYMFAFSSLPFDAPVAEFPLVLVWQKNLDWAKGTTGERGGSVPSSLPSGTIYGKAKPGSPPGQPPGPPGPTPPGPTPRPPPEVSTSGL